MVAEIELKFSLPAASHPKLLRHPALRSALSQSSKQLTNIYFDTPTLDLHRKGVALRLRRSGDVWLQTVKCAGEAAAGLSNRPEWEMPYAGRFDFSQMDGKLGDWLASRRIAPRLQPVFETSFRRRAWTIQAGDHAVELALDRGWVLASGRREAISEVEIELLPDAGPDNGLDSLFDIAESLVTKLPLMPALDSKAERGYALFLHKGVTPVRAALAPHPPPEPLLAFRQLVLTCIDHLHRNRPGVLADADAEYLHQMRVATRRLRAVLRIFRPLLPERLEEEILPFLHGLASRLGKVRDLDVLLAETVLPAAKEMTGDGAVELLLRKIHVSRSEAIKEVLQLLCAREYGVWMLRTLRSLNGSDFQQASPVGESLDAFLKRRIGNFRKRVLIQASLAGSADPAALHALRIAIKRLRYGLEFFPRQARESRHLLKTLASLQNDLGQLQDLATAGPLLLSQVDNDAKIMAAVSRIGQWHVPRHEFLLRKVRKELRQMDGTA